MKYLRRYLSLLFALVMSLSLFSVPVLADSIETDLSMSKAYVVLKAESAGTTFDQETILPGETKQLSGSNYNSATYASYSNSIVLANTDGSVLFQSGSTYKLLLENLFFNFLYNYDNNTEAYEGMHQFQASNFNRFEVNAVYSDGTREEIFYDYALIDNVIYNPDTGLHSLKFEFEAKKDIKKIEFKEWIIAQKHFNFTSTYIYATVFSGATGFKVSAEKVDESVGLLGGILGKITDLWETCESGFANMVQGITNIGNYILDLPGKIWEFIENGLKSLFIPSEEDMTAYSDKWDELLASRFGAVYQVTNILTDSWDSVMNADETNTIAFPDVSINLPGNTTFSFGGYDVQIVPDGFSFLVDSLKLIIGIVATIAFVNGMRKKYDEVMGVEK